MEQDELRRIIKQGETSTVQFKQNGLLFADEMIIPGSSIDDIDTDKIKVYLEKIDDSEIDIPPEQLYKNLNILNILKKYPTLVNLAKSLFDIIIHITEAMSIKLNISKIKNNLFCEQ